MNVAGFQCERARTHGKYCLDHYVKTRAKYRAYKMFRLSDSTEMIQLPDDLSILTRAELSNMIDKCMNEYREAKFCYESRSRYAEKYVHPEYQDENHNVILTAAQFRASMAELNLARLYSFINIPNKSAQNEPDALAEDDNDDDKIDSIAEPRDYSDYSKERAKMDDLKLDLRALNSEYNQNAALNLLKSEFQNLIDLIADTATVRINFLMRANLCDSSRSKHSKRLNNSKPTMIEFKEVRQKSEHIVVYMMTNFVRTEANEIFDMQNLQILMRFASILKPCERALRHRINRFKNHPDLKKDFVAMLAECVVVKIFKECVDFTPIPLRKRVIMRKLCDIMYKNIFRLINKCNQSVAKIVGAPPPPIQTMENMNENAEEILGGGRTKLVTLAEIAARNRSPKLPTLLF